MKPIPFRHCLLYIFFITIVMAGCYKEEHFDFPGPYPETNQQVPDSLPFPFDPEMNAGVWLMKDGVPDYNKILFKGYTDYIVKGDTLSWVQKSDGMHMLPHFNFYPLSDADHFNGDPNSYKYNWVYSKYFVPVGTGKSFFMYAKITFGTFNSTAAGLSLGKNWSTGGPFLFGLDGNTSTGEPAFFLDLYGTNGVSVNPALGWPTVTQVMVPGVPAEMMVVIVDGVFYVKINGTLVFTFKLPAEQLYYYTPQIRPWRNFVTVHDLYIESNDMYRLDYAMNEHEHEYSRIQAPALAKAANGNVLLFAEGRSNPVSAKERVAQNTIPVGNTDIIMKRSSDGGSTWSEQITVLAGENDPATYCFPQTVTLDNGNIILLYSKIGGSFASNNNNYTYDRTSQQIFKIESSDNGQTWTAPVELTNSFKDNNAYVQLGPGHGIQLTSAQYNKRLIMPVWYSNNVIKVAISDDAGQTWRLSNAVSGTNLKFGSVVELSDGRLMMISGHTATSPMNRRVSYSSDGGQTWAAAANISSTVATGNFGHLYAGVTVKGKDGDIYLVTPTNRELDGESKNTLYYPVSPTLFKSTNDGSSFSSLGQLHTKVTYYGYALPFGFMDAVALDNGTIVIAGESGVESPAEGIVVYRK